VTRLVPWLAAVYVALLPFGRSGFPLNAQWCDLVFPLLALAVWMSDLPGRWVGRQDWALGAYLAVTLVTALASPEPGTGLGHLAKQLYVAAVFLVFRGLSRDAPATARLREILVIMFSATAVISLAVVLVGIPAFGPPSLLGTSDRLPFFGLTKRLRGGLVTPEMLGNVLLVAMVLSLAFRETGTRRGRSLWTMAALVLAVAEFFTFSHSVAGFAVATALFVSPSLRYGVLRIAILAGAILVVLTVNAASVIEPGPARNDYGVGPVSLEVAGVRIDGQLNHYAALKSVAWFTFLDEPLTGIGPGRFPSATERAFREGRINARYRDKPAQSDLMGRLAESGILGGLSLVWLWTSWLRLRPGEFATMEPARRAAFAAVVGLLVNSLNADIMNFRFLWLALAWALTPPPGASAKAFSRD